MKKNALICLTLLLTYNIYSQNVFQNGSYTNNNLEEISGLIKVISESNIIFKENETAKETMFSSNTIKGYTLTNPFKRFSSFTEENQPSAFYEYVVDASTALLILNDVYYVYNSTNGLKRLEVKKIQKTTDKGVFESTINSYVGILSYYANDCKDLQAEANSVKYNRKSLSDFIIKLNKCNNAEVKDYTIDKAVVNLLDIGITLGGNFARFEDTRNNGYKTNGGSFGPSIGGFVSFSPNISKYNLTFQMGLEYNKKKVNYTYDEPNFPGARTVIHDASVIEPYLAALYQPFYNKGGILSPYIGIGTSYGFTLKHQIEINDIFSEEAFDRDVNQSFSLLFKVGTFLNINKNKFLFELAFSDYSYQTPGNAEDYGGNFQAKIGYVFNLKN
ncbi:MAG: hypothetical protein KDD03_04815 [Gelidibacter sp.]|nr:hypothetical protein [Gelidibacter sp.]